MTDTFDPNYILPKMRSLAAGECIVYHRGYLVNDLSNPNTRFIAKDAWLYMLQKRVWLFQRRRGHMDFEYIAIGRSEARA
jgi:hypothetical protein